EGDEVFATGPVLVMARHSSVADTVLPVMLAGERHGLVLRWVLKRELLWDPCLDIVGHRLDNCFVSRMPEEGSADVARVAALMDDLGPGEGVMIYPEGTRFSAQKRRALLDKATKRGDETLRARVARFQHVLPPRLGGASALLARGTDLVFLAHVGLEGSATFWDLARGGLIGQPVRVKAWRIPAREVPAEPEARIAFLHDQWAKVDAFVGGEVGV
ncbi:MAG: lysophospholipid acyltransferase family protein, partial [Myxococcales bacterium]|nr:lysophospholipid acyltransferase family protein [Myxococcales bacterium]